MQVAIFDWHSQIIPLVPRLTCNTTSNHNLSSIVLHITTLSLVYIILIIWHTKKCLKIPWWLLHFVYTHIYIYFFLIFFNFRNIIALEFVSEPDHYWDMRVKLGVQSIEGDIWKGSILNVCHHLYLVPQKNIQL